jgi:hypothetical protein
MMYRRRKGLSALVSPSRSDWQRFQTRLQQLLLAFHELARQARTSPQPASSARRLADAPDNREFPSAEGKAVQPSAHPPTILDELGINLDDSPTRAQMLSAAIELIGGCRRINTN